MDLIEFLHNYRLNHLNHLNHHLNHHILLQVQIVVGVGVVVIVEVGVDYFLFFYEISLIPPMLFLSFSLLQ